MSNISVLILTFNEEINIADCIDSCGWCDDVVVFDSLSSDRTREIAISKGARVVERAFDNYSAQRNAALTGVQYKHAWVLMVDADERVPADLAEETVRCVQQAPTDTAIFHMRRKDYFCGRWLRRSSGYPTWFGRLVRIGHVRVEREFNEEYLTDGTAARLNAHLHHYPFSKGIDFWFERHNRYSRMEAEILTRHHTQSFAWRDLLSADPTRRRRALKRVVYRMPMRPAIVFLYLFVIRCGFLDGKAGFWFSRMRATYELLINLKVAEIRRRRRDLPV